VTTLRFHKLVGQIVAGVYDEEGTLVGEETVAEVVAYANKLDGVPDDVRAAVDALNAQRNGAASAG
jgi:hypothetical protein